MEEGAGGFELEGGSPREIADRGQGVDGVGGLQVQDCGWVQLGAGLGFGEVATGLGYHFTEERAIANPGDLPDGEASQAGRFLAAEAQGGQFRQLEMDRAGMG